MRLGVAAAVVGGELVAGDLETSEGRVDAVGLSPPGTGVALPGFVDIHTHGFAGVDFATASREEIRTASLGLTSTGVTGFQPTLLTLEPAAMAAAAARHRDAVYPGARYLGTHLEGPFLSPAHAGAHDRSLLRDVDPGVVAELVDSGAIGQVTVAPELDGALKAIESLVAAGVTVAVGHSDADADTARAAFAAGASVLTHVFNAMRPFHHRDPGVVGVALTRGDVFVTAVVDNVHLSREATLLAMTVGADRFAAITDAMAAAGLGEGTFVLGNRQVSVSDGVPRLDDGTIAASVLTMDQALRNLVDLGWDLATASKSVSATPARAVGHPELGVIRVGGGADITVVDDSLGVVRCLVDGVEVHSA